jgi:bis(5'-nucleosyl)-tetraphosphatase (symmetrical)
MSTYAIGDIQGCFEPFMRLLEKIQFNAKKDILWLTGDLVNRGPKSLETLRFVMNLNDRIVTVLGNHDLTLLAVAFNAIPYDPKRHTFSDILTASDKTQLIDWLQHQPLMHHDAKLGYTLVHAGLHPKWDLILAQSLAKEVEIALQSANPMPFFENLFGNTPNEWDAALTGFARLRFIINCFTRLRFCSLAGELEFQSKDAAEKAPPGYLPWFSIPTRASRHLKILFGHWAALKGQCTIPNVFALDTGCVWGNCLTAMRLEDGKRFIEPCHQ